MSINRRGFLGSAAAASLAASLNAQDKNDATPRAEPMRAVKRPIIVCANNGFNYLDDAFLFLKNGGDTLDAAMRVVSGPENNPFDDSVGLGGLPNEEGIVELDACCMHGPTRRAGSVGGVRNIKNVSLAAKAVMEHTGHVMLVGEGAERFAVAMGFPRENLLTERSRRTWQLWKEFHSTDDWWGPGLTSPQWKAPETSPHSERWEERIRRMEERADALGIEPEFRMAAIHRVLFPPTGTIHCSALNEKGEISGCTTTAAWRSNCLDAAVILPSSEPGATPIKMWVQRVQPEAGKRTSRSPEPIPSSKTCVAACRRRKPEWMRSNGSSATTTTI